MKKIALVLCLVLPLSSCAWATETINDLLPSSPKTVAGIAIALTAVNDTAHLYTGRPVCGSSKAVGKLCSDIDVDRTIFKAKDAAYAAVQTARKIQTQTTFQAALTAFNSYKDIAGIFSPSAPPAASVNP